MQDAFDILEIKKGEIHNDIKCEQAFLFGDLLIINNGQKYTAYIADGFKSNARPYKINNELIQKVFLPRHLEMIVLQTNTSVYFRNYENEDLNKNKQWQDHYIEPFSGQFFRKDVNEIWYDLEGIALGSPIFVQDEILCSLCGKQSKKSFSFKEQTLTCNPSSSILQLGKLVLDEKLKPLVIQGKRVTSLGAKHIHLGDKHIQEVQFGLNQKRFILEGEQSIFQINGWPVLIHIDTYIIGKHRFELFKTEKQTYTFNGKTGSLLEINGEAMDLKMDSFVEFDEKLLALNTKANAYGFVDVLNVEPYFLKEISSENITFIDSKSQVIDGIAYRNITAGQKEFVYDEVNNSILKLDGDKIPTQIKTAPFYSNIFGIAKIDGLFKYFYLKDKSILKLSPNAICVGEVLESGNDKLRNATSSQGDAIVLDLRNGIDQIKQAQSYSQVIEFVSKGSYQVGDAFLQNARLRTLGGSQERVIDLNDPSLSIFTLPNDLSLHPDSNDKSSLFQLNPISHIDFKEAIEIKGEIFYPATFIPFNGNPSPVILQKGNGRPLHLASEGHKNELVISFKKETLKKQYYIGKYHMVGVNTLTEDLTERSLMMAFPEKRTLLPFEEIVLPVIANVRPYSYSTEWAYNLFEIRSSDAGSDFIAVEKVAPYRILIQKVKGIEIPKIVKETGGSLKTPEEISRFRKIFIEDPGYLKEI